ncbi:hypothetical protein AQBE111736_01515 [Aquirufa beregesia]
MSIYYQDYSFPIIRTEKIQIARDSYVSSREIKEECKM